MERRKFSLINSMCNLHSLSPFSPPYTKVLNLVFSLLYTLWTMQMMLFGFCVYWLQLGCILSPTMWRLSFCWCRLAYPLWNFTLFFLTWLALPCNFVCTQFFSNAGICEYPYGNYITRQLYACCKSGPSFQWVHLQCARTRSRLGACMEKWRAKKKRLRIKLKKCNGFLHTCLTYLISGLSSYMS